MIDDLDIIRAIISLTDEIKQLRRESCIVKTANKTKRLPPSSCGLKGLTRTSADIFPKKVGS